MRPEPSLYLQSLSNELVYQADRVRQLIGARHWLSDGLHKESVLSGVLNRHLPAGAVLSRGFVIDPVEPTTCSREQDILVLDPAICVPIFNQGGLSISFPSTIAAAITVKSTLRGDTLLDALQTLASLAAITDFDPTKCATVAFFFRSSRQYRSDPGQVPLLVERTLSTVIAETRGAGLDARRILPTLICTLDSAVARVELRNGTPHLLSYMAAGTSAVSLISIIQRQLAANRGRQNEEFELFIKHATGMAIGEPRPIAGL